MAYEKSNIKNKNTGIVYDNPKQDPKWKDKWKPKNLKKYKKDVYSKLSQLLIKNITKIEPHIKNGTGDLTDFQKTYRRGKLKKGRITGEINKKDEMMVVYQSDFDASTKTENNKKIENALLNWLEFTDLSQINLKIIPNVELDDDGVAKSPDIILQSPDKQDFNLNDVIGIMDLNEVGLDNISQYLKLDKTKTNISRKKLAEVVDTEFSELQPLTFTHLLEKYQSIKNKIPLYKYRSDDFWEEYIEEDNKIPIEYRIEKWFEEFER